MSGSRLVATYLLLSENSSIGLDQIPDYWNYIRFDTSDILYLCPFQALSDWTLGCPTGTPGNPLGSFSNRFNWAVQQARTQNPNIRVSLTMMMETGGQLSDLNTTERQDTFASSIASFLTAWKDKTYSTPSGGSIPAHLDGFDIDIEEGNIVSYLPTILAKIRKQVDATGQKYYVSICPAWLTDLNDASLATSLDYINMQNYDGGAGTMPQDYLDTIPGLKPTQLFWGISSESTVLNTQTCGSVEDAVQLSSDLAGVMSWRINSNTWVFENMAQLDLYNRIHGIALPDGLDELVVQGWQVNSGRNSEDQPTSPWLQQDWINHNEWRSAPQPESNSCA